MSNGLYDISDATATADDILVDKTAYIATGKTDGTLKIYTGTTERSETKLESTVSAFNIDLKQNERESVNMQSILSGGDGAYNATVNGTSWATSSVDNRTLNVLARFSDGGTVKAAIDVTSGSQKISIPLNITAEYCLTGDTMITMYNGTQKRIDKIELGDLVLSLNEEGKRVPGYVYYCDSHCNNVGKHYDRFVFDDDTELKVVHRHRFYNMEEQKFVHIDLWYEGDRAYKIDGTKPRLKDIHLKEYEGDVPHYTIFCEHNTYFANGILCGNRFSDPVNFNQISTFSIDNEEYYPIILMLPETFNGYKDCWIDSDTRDLMLRTDKNELLNYYQIGYTDNYGAIYKKPSDTVGSSIDEIETEWIKVCDLPHESGGNCISGEDFDAVVIYIKRPARSNSISLLSNEEVSKKGGGYSILSVPSIQR